MIKDIELREFGYKITIFPINEMIIDWVRAQNYQAIDEYFQTQLSPKGELYSFLKQFGEFTHTEFIISLRDANDPDQEDGIWHDDGSRQFAFTLSLTIDPSAIEGGQLGIRQKNSSELKLYSTPNFGEAILFLTGEYGYEHKIHRVTKGQRLIIAGWLS